jgi:hypothetical protein
MIPFFHVVCIFPFSIKIKNDRYLKAQYDQIPITLLTNDNNLSMKARSNDILSLSSKIYNQLVSSEVLIRQAIYGPLPLDNTFIRPKEGNDIRMLDISGPMEENLKFLPGLEASKYAKKEKEEGFKSEIMIDPKTGAVKLIKNGERPPLISSLKYSEDRLKEIENERIEIPRGKKERLDGFTYADIMVSKEGLYHSQHHSDEEMDWE